MTPAEARIAALKEAAMVAKKYATNAVVRAADYSNKEAIAAAYNKMEAGLEIEIAIRALISSTPKPGTLLNDIRAIADNGGRRIETAMEACDKIVELIDMERQFGPAPKPVEQPVVEDDLLVVSKADLLYLREMCGVVNHYDVCTKKIDAMLSAPAPQAGNVGDDVVERVAKAIYDILEGPMQIKISLAGRINKLRQTNAFEWSKMTNKMAENPHPKRPSHDR